MSAGHVRAGRAGPGGQGPDSRDPRGRVCGDPGCGQRRTAGARHRPGQDLRRVGTLAQPRDRAPAAPVAARGRRCVFRHPARPDAGPGGRIGLRQEHRGAPAGGAVRAHARRLRVRRAGRARRVQDARGPQAAPAHPDDLSGPVRQPEPALARGRHHCRAAARARDRDRAGRAARPGRRAAEVGRPVAAGPREVPAPVQWRAAPAHLDRACAGHAARVSGVRRAHQRAGRERAGAGAQHHERPAARSAV